jgi:gamma-glutamylcyclotransferase (GGCT)/AIG2-like uncharacterized protein YtfP
MLLFLYGVLLDSVAEGAVRELLQGLGAGRAASTGGHLYAVREGGRFYPALVSGKETVEGMVHEADTADLAALDRFEDADHPPGEYRREPITVRLEDGAQARAFAYLYNRPVTPALVPITMAISRAG